MLNKQATMISSSNFELLRPSVIILEILYFQIEKSSLQCCHFKFKLYLNYVSKNSTRLNQKNQTHLNLKS